MAMFDSMNQNRIIILILCIKYKISSAYQVIDKMYLSLYCCQSRELKKQYIFYILFKLLRIDLQSFKNLLYRFRILLIVTINHSEEVRCLINITAPNQVIYKPFNLTIMLLLNNFVFFL